MICKKCGIDNAEETKFCPNCGKTYSGAVKFRKFLKYLLFTVVVAALICLSFLFGTYFGQTKQGAEIKIPDFIETISEKLKTTLYFPIQIEYTQSDLNAMISKNKDALKPMTDIKLIFPSDGGIAVSGVVTKADIKQNFSSYLPDIVLLFLPENVSIYIEADPTVDGGEIISGINSVSIAGITLGSETLDFLGVDELISQIIANSISQGYDGKIEITSLSIEKSESKGETAMKLGVNYYLAR